MKVINIPRRFVLDEWGGTETVILETCKRLSAMGHDISIFTSMALAENRFEMIDHIPVKRFSHFYPYFGLTAEAVGKLDKKGGNLFSIGLFAALLKDRGTSLIHLHTGKRLGGIAATAAKLKGIPYLLSLHGGLLDVPATESQSWTEPTRGMWEWGKLLGAMFGSRQVVEKAAAVICVNRDEARQVATTYPHTRVEYLPNGVDTRKFSFGADPEFRQKFGIPADAFMILTCGRIDPQKNQLFLASLLPELRKIRPDTCIVLLGPATNTQYEQQLQQLMAEEPFRSGIKMLGGRPPGHPDLLAAFHAADLFVLPSIHEPFGIVILEAWAAGLPVLASRTGGIPAFVEQGVDGLLFEKNDAKSLLDSFASIARNSELAAQLAKNGREKARSQYDWAIITDRLERLYQELV